MIKKTQSLLSTPQEIRELAHSLAGARYIAFDTEFIRESTFYPIVEIIQIATEEQSWLVDAAVFKRGFRPGPQGSFDPGIQPLLEVLLDPASLKIVHAAQGDQECLYTCFNMVAHPVFDTSVAASLCGFGEAVGLGKLLKSVLGVTISKGHARTNWSVRPLPPQLIEYAHADVEHLVRLGKELLERVEKLGRKEWALELSGRSENKALYDADYEAIAERLARGGRLDRRGYGSLIELIRWREERVRQLNLPRRWVADDTVLMDLASVRPKDLAHLSSFRGLNKGELKSSGETILAALRAGQAQADKLTVPSSPRIEPPNADEGQAMDLLKCYVGILADRHRIAAKHLMTSGQLLTLLRSGARTPEDLVRMETLGPEAASLIGEDLIAFVSGKRALYVQDCRVKVTTSEPKEDEAP